MRPGEYFWGFHVSNSRAVGSPSNLMDSAGDYAAACALLPGLPILRRTAAAYKKTNPKIQHLCALVDMLEKQISSRQPGQ